MGFGGLFCFLVCFGFVVFLFFCLGFVFFSLSFLILGLVFCCTSTKANVTGTANLDTPMQTWSERSLDSI